LNSNTNWPAELLDKETGEIIPVHSIVYENKSIRVLIKKGYRLVDADTQRYNILSKDFLVYVVKKKKLVKIILRRYV
jgi:hypothetical protein